MPMRRAFAGAIFLIVSLAIAIPIQGTHAEPNTPAAHSSKLATDATCEEILTRAMQSLQSTCNDVTRNSACYGNNQVKVEPKVGAALKFDVVGDRAPIRNIRTLITSPLDVERGLWGLSLLKLQANLPDTLPGQNLTFLVFGNTSIENTSGDMQSFYFSTGLGNLTCKAAPRDGIIVRSPQHTEVTFTANGVKITIASTIVLRAERHKSMSVELVEGHARLTTSAGSQTLKPGQVATVPLGGTNGLTATDAPSNPAAAASDAALEPVLVTTDKLDDPDAPVNIAIDGCISAVKGNTVTVNEYQVNVGNDSTLKNAKIGDCVHVEGTQKADKDNKPTLDVVKAQSRGRAGSSAGGASSHQGQDNGGGNGNNGNGGGNSNGNGNSNSNGNGNGNSNGNSNGNGNGGNGGGGGNGNSNGNGNGNGNGNANGNNGNGNGNGNGGGGN